MLTMLTLFTCIYHEVWHTNYSWAFSHDLTLSYESCFLISSNENQNIYSATASLFILSKCEWNVCKIFFQISYVLFSHWFKISYNKSWLKGRIFFSEIRWLKKGLQLIRKVVILIVFAQVFEIYRNHNPCDRHFISRNSKHTLFEVILLIFEPFDWFADAKCNQQNDKNAC